MPEPKYRQALPTGYALESYRMIDVLGVGGFGVTYLAQHTRLGHKVALKEYLPNEIAIRDGTTVHPKSRPDEERFQWGLERFLDEAKTLTRFRHPNLVRVTDYFEANNTAYFVMDYEVGKPLNVLLAGRRLNEMQLRRVLWPILDGLKTVHSAGVLHRDIKPANIFIRQHQESPVLLDFGSARAYVGQNTSNPTSLVSPGYSPWEQYFGTEGDQGPWTDIYSLAGVCYRAVTGKPPVDALRRMNSRQRGGDDPQPALVGRHSDYSEAMLTAIDAGLHIAEPDRPQTIEEWQRLLEGGSAGRTTTPTPKAQAPPDNEASRVAQPASPVRTVKGAPHDAENAQQAQEAPVHLQTKSAKRKHLPRSLVRWLSAAAAAGVAASAAVVWLGTRADAPQRLTIDATPVDATVAIGGLSRPYSEEGVDLDPGEYQIVVSAPGYRTHRETVAHGDAPTRLRVVLTALTAPFTIEPDPPGAVVSILSPADTPYMPGVDLPPGQYRVRVAAAGFEPEVFDLAHGREPTVHAVTLLPVKQPFTVETIPSQARVRILNIKDRYEPGMLLAPGEYRVEVTARGYQTVTDVVSHGTIPTGYAVTLSKSVPPLTIVTDPPAANVQLLDSQEPYTPGMRLPAGEYWVQASAPGHITYRGPIHHDDTTSTHHVRLRASMSLEPDMRHLEAGSFVMGDLFTQGLAHPLPTRTVTVPAFALSAHEVTYAEFDRFSAATGKTLAQRPENPGRSYDDYPVTNVSWTDAVAYADWLSAETGKRYRLPTEAEWEYAARAGTATLYSFGNDETELCQWANLADQTWAEVLRAREPNANTSIALACSDGEAGPAPADSYAANRFGLKNMHGNVWEWVADCFEQAYADAPDDGSAWNRENCTQRVVRGGAANSSAEDVRSAYREPRPVETRHGSIGFRLAQDLQRVEDADPVSRP